MNLRLIHPRKYRQLFLDDGAIESQKGTRRTLHPPKKCGPLIKGGYQSRTAPQWNADKGIWEWWYMGQHIHYARSTDGQNWEQPALGLYEVNGSRENNIVCDPEGGHQQRLYHVLYDPSAPDPKRRYKGLFSSSNRYLGTSADGLNCGRCWMLFRYRARTNPSSLTTRLANNILQPSNRARHGDVPYFCQLARTFPPSPSLS